MSNVAIYRRLFSRALNEGAISALKGIDMTDADFTTLQKELGLKRGQRFIDQESGKAYRVVRARSTFAEGNTLKLYFAAANRLPTMTAASTKSIVTTNKTYVAQELVGGELFLTAGTAIGQVRKVVDNDATAGASTITVAERDSSYPGTTADGSPDAFTALPDGTTTGSIVVPFEYVQTTAATDIVKGIALGAVTSGNWTVVQDDGLSLVLCDGTSALAAGNWIAPSATAGTAVVAPNTGVGASASFGMIIDAYAVAAGALRQVDLLIRGGGRI